jgi:adenylate cyclase
MSKIIITNYHGTIDKFMGDAIMAIFGAPIKGENDLKNALCCAVDMQIAMDEINEENKSLGLPELFMGIGINTGTVVAGQLGSDYYSEYTVIGDEVNLTARVEAYSLRGQIIISSNVYDKARDFIETVEPIDVYMKGKKARITIYELLSVKTPELRSVPRREIRKSPRVEVFMDFTYQCIEGKTILPEKHEGIIVDISYNGLFASTLQPLEQFSDIKFTLTLSMLGSETSDIYAKVVKVLQKDGKHYASMEFTSIRPEAKIAIKSFMERIIQGV